MTRLSLLLVLPAGIAMADQPATTPNNRQATAHAHADPAAIEERTAGRVDQTAPPIERQAPQPAPVIDLATIDRLVDERLALRGDTAGWDNGFYIQNREHTARLKIGGVTQFDGRFFVPRDSDPKVDQFGSRSIRPDLQGTVVEHYELRLFPDFAGGKLVVQDAYADVHYGETVKLRVGKFKVPFGLERLHRSGTTLMDTPVAHGRHWRATAQADYFAGPVGVLAEYVHAAQHVALNNTNTTVAADSWQVLGQWVLTGDDASYKSVTPRHPFESSKGHYGAFDVTARIGELRFATSDVFDAGLADPTKSAQRVWNAGAGLDWFPNRTFRFVLDSDRTWFRLGAKTGDRPTETSIVARAQTLF